MLSQSCLLPGSPSAAIENFAPDTIRLSGPSADQLAARLAVARDQWQLTARQRQVLKALVLGLSNKEIATRLGCAEVTIEFHLTTMLRRSAATTRSRLVAKFWLQLVPQPLIR